MGKKLNLEIIKREQAFQLYKKLRNIKEISELPGMPSYTTLLKWKEEDKWDERIEKTQQKLQDWLDILNKLENDSLLKDDLMQLVLLNKLLERTIYAIIDKDLEPTSWKEAIETLKFIFDQKRLLLGRPTSKSEIDIDFSNTDETELRQMLRKINDLLQAPNSPFSIEEQVKETIKKQALTSIEDLYYKKSENLNNQEFNQELASNKNKFFIPIEEDE